MKKSKFLKKSLATLLALMLVVAMIPVGASAATPPEVTQVTVNGVEATLSGTEYSAEITAPSKAPEIKVTLKDANGSVGYDNGSVTKPDGTYTFAMSASDYAAKKAAFATYDTDGNKVAEYTVTYTEKGKGTDTGVKAVTHADQYGESQLDGNAYTITVPYGTNSTQEVTVVLNDSNATVDGATKVSDGIYTVGSITVGTAKSFVVAAENGAKKAYSVKLVVAKAFTAFSVEGERKAADIARVSTDTTLADKTVKVYMPFGTTKDATTKKFKFTPTFTKGYDSATITADKLDGTKVAIKSGEEIELSEFVDLSSDNVGDVSLDLEVTYTGTANETWTISFDVPSKDPVPAIKGLKVDNFIATIDGNNITLELPSDKRVDTTNVQVLASAGTKVLAVGSGVSELTIAGDYNASDVLALKIKTNNKFTLRVTAAGNADGATSPEVKDYYLTVKTAEAKSAKIETMTLANTEGTQFDAVIRDDGTILFNLPYAASGKADLAGWKLFYTLSSGATISGYTAVSGAALTGSEGILPSTFDGETAGDAITVATDKLNSKVYTIAVKRGDPSKASTLSGLKITKATTYADLADTNTVSGTVSSKAWTVSIPYSQYADYDEKFISAVLPENAKLYYVATKGSGSPAKDSLVELDNVDKKATSAVTSGLPDMATYEFNGKAGKTPLTLVVASEAAVGKITSGTTLLSNLDIGTYSTYTLVMKQEDAKKVAKLDSFSVYDATSKTTVNGVVSEAKQEITITLPASFAKEVTNGVTRGLFLDFNSSNNEVIAANTRDVIKKLTLDSAGNVVVADSTKLVASNSSSGKTLSIDPATGIASISVKSEDSLISGGTTSEEKNYKLVVDFAKAETGSTLNSVTINNVTAKPDASNKVVITLPYGTEVTHLIPKFDVSKNAFVSTTASNVGYIAPGTAMNLTSKKTLNVISETGANKTVYTLEVKVAEQFTDVKEGVWYYDYVMAAAKAGIVNGKGNGIFDPEGNVTRRDFALMTVRMLQADTSSYTASPFKDVDDNDYALAAIAYCYDKKIIGGYEDGTFRPGATISREEAAKILCVALGLDEVKNPTEKFKDDAKIQNWAKGYVYACKAAGIFGGDNGNFLPGNPITRAETAKVMVISMGK